MNDLVAKQTKTSVQIGLMLTILVAASACSHKKIQEQAATPEAPMEAPVAQSNMWPDAQATPTDDLSAVVPAATTSFAPASLQHHKILKHKTSMLHRRHKTKFVKHTAKPAPVAMATVATPPTEAQLPPTPPAVTAQQELLPPAPPSADLPADEEGSGTSKVIFLSLLAVGGLIGGALFIRRRRSESKLVFNS